MGIELNSALAKFQATSNNSVLPRVDVSDKEKLKEAASEFEALFVKQMLDTMRKTLHKEDRLIEGGMAEDIFEDMLYTEYSRLMTKSGDFGIANGIINQYERFVPAEPYQ
jgi:flagellar protein FlgJ